MSDRLLLAGYRALRLAADLCAVAVVLAALIILGPLCLLGLAVEHARRLVRRFV